MIERQGFYKQAGSPKIHRRTPAHNRIYLIEKVVQLALVCLLIAIYPAGLYAYNVGGSNYPMIESHLDQAGWFEPGTLLPVIASYHQKPDQVYSQMKEMRRSGQKAIAFILWYAESDVDTIETYGTHVGHVLRIARSNYIHPQIRQNLIELLAIADELGFEKIIMRYAPQKLSDTANSSHPKDWETWKEQQFQFNWNVVYYFTSLIESMGLRATVLYDLALEMGGLRKGQARAYVKRLWANFCYVFDTREAFFSIAVRPGRVANLLEDLQHDRPRYVAVDFYEDAFTKLQYISEELIGSGATGHKLIVAESFYNDPDSAADIRTAEENFGLNIDFVMQWPLSREAKHAGARHFSMHYAAEYAEYLPAPRIETAGFGCADKACVWMKVENFQPWFEFRVESEGVFQDFPPGSYKVRKRRNKQASDVITFRVTDREVRREMQSLANIKLIDDRRRGSGAAEQYRLR